MKVVGVRPRERRRDKRLTLRPLTVEFDGKSFETMDWGLGGFLIEGYYGPYMTGDCLHVRVVVDDGKRKFSHFVQVRIRRITRRSGKLAANFIDLDDAAFDTLEGWLSGRLSRDVMNETAK